MPKLHSPFVRKNINGNYIVTPEIDPDYRWVFEDESVICQEKLDGTNVSIVIEDGRVTKVFNRTNEMDMLSKNPVMEAVRNAYEKDYCNFTDGQYFGEAVGDRIQGNPYKLKDAIWLPFNTYFVKHLTYRTWGKYLKTYEVI